MTENPLRIYLNDHMAGSVGAIELIERWRRRSEGTPLGATLGALQREIEADQQVLHELIERVGGGENPMKKAGAWMAEKLARLKLADAADDDSGLGLFEALETLVLGVQGKRGLWSALAAAQPTEPRLAGLDLARLVERARRQEEELERLRLDAARRALGGGVSGARA